MKKLIIANWKMQLSLKESLALAQGLKRRAHAFKSTTVLCPDYAALAFVGPLPKGSVLALGAQDSAGAIKGAYTGEVSPLNLKALGVKYVILGHSERREHLHENSAIINAKLQAALASGLIPILCVGEKIEEKEAGETRNYLREELRHALKGLKLKNASSLAIAYEPVWAISTNKSARSMLPAEADFIQKFIKQESRLILKHSVRVLYGGSVNTANAGEFLKQKNVDGLLVGAASLQIQDFSQICSI